MARWLFAIALLAAGCGDNQPGGAQPPIDAADTTFEFHATADWSAMYTPNVTSVTIGGTPVASGGNYEINVVFASYEAALATFQPIPVVVTTTTGQQVFTLAPGYCSKITQCSPPPDQPDACLQPITYESDSFFVDPQPSGDSVDFAPDCGSCMRGEGATRVGTVWCTRTGAAG